MARNLSWAPTIALSWLWGLGFFFSFHVTLAYGWLGFAAFAAPNAFGLLAFGWILGDRRRDPIAVFHAVQTRYAGLFLSSQVLAVAITIFASFAYLFIPLFGLVSLVIVAIFALLAIAVGHAATLGAIKRLHALYLLIGVAAAGTVLVGIVRHAPPHVIPLASFDGLFYGLMLPSLVGFLLGPWTDVQHWQRAVAIHAEGGSIRRAYLFGALLFLVLITLNALIAGAAGPALVFKSADGLPGFQAAVAGAITKAGGGALAVAFVLWAGVAIASTLDSFYLATRWLLKATTAESTSPLMAFVPVGLVTSPIWFLVTAILIAVFCVAENIAMIFLMMAYATLFVGAATCLVCEVVTGRNRYDSTLCALIGFASVLVFIAGYLGAVPIMIAVAPLLGLVGAFPALQDLVSKATAKVSASPVASKPPARPRALQDVESLETGGVGAGFFAEGAKLPALRSHGFEGRSFVMHLTPTYDDTNAVGNVYFANYVRWVGKARELMFNERMPDFDLHKTTFFILTKSFTHQFRQEIHEFQPVKVILTITAYNRKFVTLAHEITTGASLVGRGEQVLMFVDVADQKALDIPKSIMQGFMPYFPEKLDRRRTEVPRASRTGFEDLARK